jgi:hypothetical protein
VAGDVLKEDPLGLNLSDDPGNVRPKVPGIILALSLSRCGKRLAWVSGKHGVADTAPRPPIEGLDVVPDRGRGEVSCALCGDEDGSGVFLPLDEAGGGKARLGKVKTHVKSAAA